MSEKPYLLFLVKPSANKAASYLRVGLGVLGVLVVLYGAYDVFTKLRAASALTEVLSQTPTKLTPLFRESAPSISPTRLVIPAIGVNAVVESVGKNDSGAMKAPKKFSDVAWYELGALPGEAGNAVFAGHVNNALTKAGVFEHVSDLKIGDTVFVTEDSGYSLSYYVTGIENYTNANAPLVDIFSVSGPSGLVLITCAGDWDPRARSYDKRLVVYTRLLAQ